MGLLDFVTGGHSSAASDAMRKAQEAFANLQTPTVQQLTLPQLQQYVEAGLMTPEQMQAYIQENNAYNDENVDQTGTRAQIQAINQLAGVANAGPNGTPMEQAQVADTIDKMNQSVAGQRGAIAQEMQARGTPASLIQAALQGQQQGQDASQAHRDALQAQAQAYQQAVDAMSKGSTAGANLQGQQNTQANTVAQAQNAMQQFNAANRQQASQVNAGNRQSANLYNTTNKQNVSNANVGGANERAAYNAKLPQQVYEDQAQKASGQAGAYTNIGNLEQAQGKQNAGIWSGIIGAGSTALAGMPVGAPNMGQGGGGGMAANGGSTDPYHLHDSENFAHGGIVDPYCMDDGGMVPGQATVPGDSGANDTIHAMVSPGEAVIPRTAVQKHMPEVLSILSGSGSADQDSDGEVADVATLLKAMRSIRMGVA